MTLTACPVSAGKHAVGVTVATAGRARPSSFLPAHILACSHMIAKCWIYRIGSPRRRDVLVCCHLDEHLTEAHRASRPPGAAENTRRTGAEELSLFPAADMHQTAYQGDHRTRLMKITAKKKMRQSGKKGKDSEITALGACKSECPKNQQATLDPNSQETLGLIASVHTRSLGKQTLNRDMRTREGNLDDSHVQGCERA